MSRLKRVLKNDKKILLIKKILPGDSEKMKAIKHRQKVLRKVKGLGKY